MSKSKVLSAALSVNLVLITCFGVQAEPAETLVSPNEPPGTVPLSLANEGRAAVDRGLDWLEANQKEDGSWSNGDFPALTALAMQAFLGSGDPDRDAVRNAKKFILSCVRDDGGIYRHVEGRKGGGLSNYNTAICMTALHATGDRSLARVIQKARDFIAGAQHFGDDIYSGGFGYDRSTGRAYTDLLNTYYAVTAMRETQDVEDLRPAGEQKADIDWKETTKFIEKMQNKPEAGKENAGGFTYNPSDPKAGSATNENGVVFFRSYGSITYAGLLALIYADVSDDDPRVLSALDWSARHWTLEENPGMGAQGLYFFYNVLTKSLHAANRDLIPREDGSFVNWRADLVARLVSRQRIEPDTGRGYWRNENGRFWENDPVLATAYSVIALQRALGG